MKKTPKDPVQYGDYLKIKELTSLQNLRSEEMGAPAHDETLFIITHQTYELWFKQVLVELDSILNLFAKPPVSESSMGTIVARLQRVKVILQLLIQQIDVLETMTPMDFLDFREYLYPASGFQSSQFRLVEIKLGLKREQRLPYNSCPFEKALAENEQAPVLAAESKESLLDHVEKWLERSPALTLRDFDFWNEYEKAVHDLLKRDRSQVRTHLPPEDHERNLAEIDKTEKAFESLFSENEHKKLQAEGYWRMSHRALRGALFILLYRDQPLLQLPFQFLTTLKDLDELLTTWRSRHALMAYRMLGTKIGTGGSSGHKYLSQTADHHRVFKDLFNLVTFMIPRSEIPKLPEKTKEQLNFVWK